MDAAAATVVCAASVAAPETNECLNRSSTVPLISNIEITKVGYLVFNITLSERPCRHTAAGASQRRHVEESNLL